MGGDGIVDRIIDRILESVDLEQDHIDKAKEIIDMVSFTKQDGKDVILIQIGENIEIKITR